MLKNYCLLGPDGIPYQSSTPGELGGNSKLKIYGQLDCPSANAALAKGYAKRRVFFANETEAIAAGYRPCGRCMRERYGQWKAGGSAGSSDYPWLRLPK
jgi:Metal binding domain of Ada